MFKLLAMSDPVEPEAETPPPTGATVKKAASPHHGIALFGFRERDDAEPQGDSDTSPSQSDRDSKVA